MWIRRMARALSLKRGGGRVCVVTGASAGTVIVVAAGTSGSRVTLGEGGNWTSSKAAPHLPEEIPGYKNMHVLRRTNYTVALFTTLRSKDSKQGEFVSATRTLTNLILNEAMSLLPTYPRTVHTPVAGASYSGLTLPDPATDLCVVSILRAADSMADSITHQYPGIPVGKVLIQRNEDTALPMLYFSKLPKDIKSRLVLLVDPMLATGGSASMAVKVLKEAGVKEEHVYMLSIVAAPEGLLAMQRAHPKVHVIVGEVDDKLNSKAYIVPGLGDFGDRFFGTD